MELTWVRRFRIPVVITVIEEKKALWATRDVRTRPRPGAVVLSLSQEPGTGWAATVARIPMRHTIEDFLADRAIRGDT